VKVPLVVPLVDLRPQHAETGEAALAAVAEVARGGRFILGETVARFERTLEGLVGAAHAVGVASGTDALVLALTAAGVGPGDLVATTSVTFAATAEAIVRAGAEPLFCEPDAATFCLDPAQVRARIASLGSAERKRLRAIVPVHLFGRTCDMAGLGAIAEEHDLVVVEDAAQALGARTQDKAAGTLGAAGCYSFFPTKNLGGWGDGGAVVTPSEELAACVRSLRQHGIVRGRFARVGMNSRLDAVQAAVLEVKAARLDAWTRARVVAAERYRALLEGIVPPGALQDPGGPGEHAYHLLVLRVDAREALERHLAERGVESRAYYMRPLWAEDAFRGFAPKESPGSALAGRLLALPMFYGITEAQQRHVVTALRSFFE
jgi:dTDP-4-amino-4,6-dideoxygalactose transaminase